MRVFIEYLRQVNGRLKRRAYKPAALFGGGFDHGLPVRLFLGEPVTFELDLAAFGEHGADRGHAQFHRLGQGEVHAITACDGLIEGDRQRRFAFRRIPGFDRQRHALAPRLADARPVFMAIAVEQRNRCVAVEAQHGGQMMALGIGQFDYLADRERGLDEHPRDVGPATHASVLISTAELR